MLWLKSWLECRARLYLCLLTGTAMLLACWLQIPAELGIKPGHVDSAMAQKFWKAFVILVGVVLLPIGGLILAGSGVIAQTSWGMLRGFHPSTYFLLGLPLRRERLLRVRFVLGALLLALWLAVTAAIHFLIAALYQVPIDYPRALLTLPHMFLVSLIAFSMATWLSTFLDEVWSGTMGLVAFGGLAGYSLAGGKGWLNFGDFCFQAQLFTYNPPFWLQGAVYLTICGIFYAAALYVVENKEY